MSAITLGQDSLYRTVSMVMSDMLESEYEHDRRTCDSTLRNTCSKD